MFSLYTACFFYCLLHDSYCKCSLDFPYWMVSSLVYFQFLIVPSVFCRLRWNSKTWLRPAVTFEWFLQSPHTSLSVWVSLKKVPADLMKDSFMLVSIESVRRFVAVLEEIARLSLPGPEYHKILTEEFYKKNYFGIYPAASIGRIVKQWHLLLKMWKITAIPNVISAFLASR